MSKPTQPPGSQGRPDFLRLQKLAKGIEALAEKDRRQSDLAREIASVRKSAAGELYSVCANFVDALNDMLEKVEVLLDPSKELVVFRDNAPNLIQVNARGRILEIQYHATEELLSTEDFRVPYTVSGALRAFNQELLDRNVLEEQLLFYTVEETRRMWRYFDPRTHRSGTVDQAYLISMMELLV